jgi:formylmethanofuran dehydrogenase subunit A
VTFRDVVILDGDNKVIAVYNLTSNSLGTSANYAALKQLFLDAAN